jgi:hypothetical protein
MTERTIENYLGIELVAAFYKGEYQGKAWGKKSGHAVAHVKGISIQDVIGKLRQSVDSPELQAEFKRALIAKHGDFLRRKGINPSGISVHQISKIYDRSHRTTGCYECKSGLDNEIDLECPRCSWIVCTNCGACGCGHPKYGPEINRPVAQSKNDALPTEAGQGRRTFPDYASASGHARHNAGSVLCRHPTQDGWIVTYKALTSLIR